MGTNIRRNVMPNVVPIAIILCCTCVLSVGCKSMKGNFPKVAFWKKDKPPVSELASRSSDSLAPPSQSASVLDGTLSPRGESSAPTRSPYGRPDDKPAVERYAAADGAARSAYGQGLSTPKQPAGFNSQLDAQASNQDRYSLDTARADAAAKSGSIPSSGSFGQSDSSASLASVQRPTNEFSDPKSMTNPYTLPNTLPKSGFGSSKSIPPYNRSQASTTAGVSDGFASGSFAQGGIEKRSAAPASTGVNSGFASTGNPAGFDKPASKVPATTGQYPSTKFGSFASTASGTEPATPNQGGFGQVSQASSTEPIKSRPAAGNSSSSVPVAALNRQGSYAPGSTGASTASAYSGGFGAPASNAACESGCGCSGCRSASSTNADTRGGSFMK